MMRKDILLPGAAVVGGAVGFILRRWQWASAYDAGTQLFQSGAAASMALLGLLLAMTLFFTLAARGGTAPKDFFPAFHCPISLYMAGMAAAGFLFFGAGALGLLSGLEQFNLWRAYPDAISPTYPLTQLLCAGLCLPAGLSCLVLGKACYRQTLTSAACVLSSFLPLLGGFWLFVAHREHSTDPILMRYGVTLLAIGLLTVAQYDVSAYLFGRRHPWRMCVCAALGSALALTALADSPDYFSAALLMAFSLSALSQCYALLRCRFGPAYPRHLVESRMPFGAEDRDLTDDHIESDSDKGV